MRVLILIIFFISLYANQKVSILLDWKYQFEFAGYIAAKEKGFYKDEGLDVHLIEYSNQHIVDDVVKGKYDFGIYNNHLVDEKIKGKPVKLVASIFKRSALVLLTKPNIKTLKDLEYKTVMLAINNDQSTFNFLKYNHINLSTIKFVNPTFTLEPFIDNKVDAMSAFTTNETYLLQKKGIKFNVINPSDYNFLMYQGELFTSDKFANSNPVLVDKIKKATIRGWKYALKHKNEIINIILQKYNTQHKSRGAYKYEAKEIEKIIEPYIYPIGYINKELLKAEFLYEAEKLHKKIDINKILNDYIFEFQNPLNLNDNHLFLIELYNLYLKHKYIILISFIFLITLYFYIRSKKQKNYIETLFNKAPMAYVLMDAQTKDILKVNQYAYDLYGYDKKDGFTGTSKEFHINELHYKKLKKKVNEYIEKNNTINGFDIEWPFKKKNGTIFWSNVKAISINKNLILWVLSDVTKLMNIQEELNQQIVHTKIASKVKGEFLANMSHEIRTPLNAILGFVDIIYNKEKDIENKKYLEIIKKSGKSLLTIINDILDFSKIESGKLKIEKIEFNPKEEFETLISLFENKSKEKNINLQISFIGLNYCIISDPTRIKQIISNLISNAIKFTPENKNIYCNINYNKESEKLYVEVIDEGIGIKQENINDIFNAFSQADTSTTRKYGGTGLGLTISKNLTSLLGGKLEIKSEIGKGSNFYFSIPAKKTKLITESCEIKENIDKDKKFDGKILIVEDNKANQVFFKVILNFLGIKDIIIANDGIEAVQKANDEFDIIFMDENMPNMNGIEATKKIKENGIKVPIVAVTANALSGDKEKFLKVMDAYLPKPVEKDKLINILDKYLKEKND